LRCILSCHNFRGSFFLYSPILNSFIHSFIHLFWLCLRRGILRLQLLRHKLSWAAILISYQNWKRNWKMRHSLVPLQYCGFWHFTLCKECMRSFVFSCQMAVQFSDGLNFEFVDYWNYKAWNEGRGNVLWSVRKKMLMWYYLHAIIRKVLKTTTSVNKLFEIFGHLPKKLNYSSGKHFRGLFFFFIIIFFFAKHEDYCSDIFIFRITNYKHVIIINNRFFSFLYWKSSWLSSWKQTKNCVSWYILSWDVHNEHFKKSAKSVFNFINSWWCYSIHTIMDHAEDMQTAWLC